MDRFVDIVRRLKIDHVVIALAMQLAVVVLMSPFVRGVAGLLAGALVASAWYHGREKRDTEIASGLPMRRAWLVGWLPWQMSTKSQFDWGAPTVAVFAVVLLGWWL